MPLLFVARSVPPPAPDPATLALLARSRTPRDAHQLHARLVAGGLLRGPSLAAGVLLRLIAAPRRPLRLLARRLFTSLADPHVDGPFLWNALIKASSSHDPFAALLLLSIMLAAGVAADEYSFSSALKACSRISSFKVGIQIHSFILKTELSSNLYLQNALVAFYCKCGLYGPARQLFDRIADRDTVSWNSMIDGYVKNGRLGLARELFDGMIHQEKNLVTWNSMIGGFAASVDGIDFARHLFDEMPARDLVSWNLMINGYVKCGRLSDAEDLFEQMPERDVISWANMIAGYMEVGSFNLAWRFFDEMPEKDVVTWNIMLDGYAKHGRFYEALHLFNEMRVKGNIAPDTTTLATALSVMSELGCVHGGIAIHKYIKRNCLPLDGKLGVSLINMYSKCGRLEDALLVFEISRGSVDHWNAMIGGLAIHGYGGLALRLFWEMGRCSLKPDDITFIGVLNACSHAGLVEEGLMCFQSMRRDYQLEPKVQHYGCMVDILSRAGRLEEAFQLIERMPIEPNDIVWRSLLSACRSHHNFDMGQKAAENLIEGGSSDPSSYVLLSNLCAGIQMWGNVSKFRMVMREENLKKVPGCSWIELNGLVHEFAVGDNLHSHPKLNKEIYSLL